MKSIKNKLSDFWIVDKFDMSQNESLLADNSVENYMKLASLRRSIGDFVRILTKRNIPVKYITGDTSFTDGEAVYITAQIDGGNIDSTVGLALHEGSHIKLTDFSVLETLGYNISDDVYKKCESKGGNKDTTKNIVKQLLNWVEDRRIDDYVKTTAPGYRGYYKALYDRYFHSDEITKGLKSNEFRTEDLESYFYRIINLTNPESDLDALNGLRKIYECVDLKNINRLSSTLDALSVAQDIFHIILDNIDKIEPQEEGDGEEGNGEGQGDEEGDVDGQDSEGNDKVGKKSEGHGNGTEKLTKKELEDLLEDIEEQKDFLDGNIKKVKLSGNDFDKVDQIGEAGTEIKRINVNMDGERTYESVYNLEEFKVLVINKVNEAMFDSGVLSFSNNSYNRNDEPIIDGIRMGRQLGRKLQIRNEEKLTQFTRKDTGKIDRRLMAELGFGNASVFKQTFVEEYTDAILHMSIDISGSMGGIKLDNALKTATAICQVASMTNGNLNVVVDVRGVDYHDSPFVAIVYDSRVDKMTKIKKLFPRITTSGTTPEGLCFAAIQDIIESSTTKLNSYFLNFSDGEPFFREYSGSAAAEHTRGEVNKMRQKGIKVLSYFISRGYNSHKAQFNRMYGQSASFINTNSLMDVARTLNKMFITDK